MHIEAWDSVFVRARRRDVHPVLAHLDGYGRWWPGVRPHAVDERTVRLHLRAPGLLGVRPAQRVTYRVVKDRRDLGLDFALAGDIEGSAEWYYLDERAGTVVHYLLRGRVAQHGWRAALRVHRAALRAGLHALKDRLEGERLPGDEPHAQLLADQVEAQAAFRAGVEAHARKQAALAAAQAEAEAEAQTQEADADADGA